jgi:hypothetical protein
MKNLLRLEELLQFGLAIFLFSQLSYPAWMYVAFFLAPDLSMIGFLINTQIGAVLYNIFHHKGLAIAAYLVGAYLIVPELLFAGTLLLGHSAFDRIFGYGLKYPDNFKNTHLGWIGKSAT